MGARVGREVSRLQQARKPVPGGLASVRLAHKLVFSKLQGALAGRCGSRSRGAAALQGIAEFFHARIHDPGGYGLTETCPSLTFNRLQHFKLDGGAGQPGSRSRWGGREISAGRQQSRRATQEAGGHREVSWDGWFATGIGASPRTVLFITTGEVSHRDRGRDEHGRRTSENLLKGIRS